MIKKAPARLKAGESSPLGGKKVQHQRIERQYSAGLGNQAQNHLSRVFSFIILAAYDVIVYIYPALL